MSSVGSEGDGGGMIVWGLCVACGGMAIPIVIVIKSAKLWKGELSVKQSKYVVIWSFLGIFYRLIIFTD